MSTETNVMPTPAGVRPPVTLKCTSPATVAAMRIARSAGLVTSTMGSPMGAAPRKGGDAGDGGGTLLVYDDEKENIDPVTGTHARLASGASASRRASANGARLALPRARGIRVACLAPVFKFELTDARAPRSHAPSQTPSRPRSADPARRRARTRPRGRPSRTSPRSSTRRCVFRATRPRFTKSKKQRHFFPLGFELL